MGSGGQNQSYNNSWNQNPSYSGMFSGAAQNYGNPAQQAFAPLAQQASSYNPFQAMGMFSSPFAQPNYSLASTSTNSGVSNTAPSSVTSTASQANSSPALNQSQINTIAGLPASGSPLPTPQATPSPTTAPVSPGATGAIPSSVLSQLNSTRAINNAKRININGQWYDYANNNWTPGIN